MDYFSVFDDVSANTTINVPLTTSSGVLTTSVETTFLQTALLTPLRTPCVNESESLFQGLDDVGVFKAPVLTTLPRTASAKSSSVKRPPQKDTCPHAVTVIEGVNKICTDCGSEIEKVQTFEREWRCYDTDSKRNPARCIARKTDAMIIFKDLENMGIGEHVISVANEIYVQVTKGQIKRGKSSRKAIIAACLFHAYNRLGFPKSCDALREMFKDATLLKSDFLHGFKHVALNIDKATGMHTTYITPQDIIYELMGILNSTQEQRDSAIKFYEELEPYSRLFKESRPQSVAAGVVFHYITNKITEGQTSMTLKEFSAKVKISELTIGKIRNEISRILSIAHSGGNEVATKLCV